MTEPRRPDDEVLELAKMAVEEYKKQAQSYHDIAKNALRRCHGLRAAIALLLEDPENVKTAEFETSFNIGIDALHEIELNVKDIPPVNTGSVFIDKNNLL